MWVQWRLYSYVGTVEVIQLCGYSGGYTVMWVQWRLHSYVGTVEVIQSNASLGDFLLAPECPIDKATLWVGFLYLTVAKIIPR